VTLTELYDRDFYKWTRCNATLLRAGRLQEADLQHIAEEIEDMGKSQRRELESRLEVLLAHLLKWRMQPNRRGRSWRATITVQRLQIIDLLDEMPSLRNIPPGKLSPIYDRAVLQAVAETDLPEQNFPASCPFTIDQILDSAFFPE